MAKNRRNSEFLLGAWLVVGWLNEWITGQLVS